MTLDRRSGAVEHRRVADLPSLLRPGDVFVVNDTKVLPARLFGTDEKGRRTEFLLVEREKRSDRARERDNEPGSSENAGPRELWRCLAKPGRRVKAGRTFFFEGGWEAVAVPAAASAPQAETSISLSSPSRKGALTADSSTGLYSLSFRRRGSRDVSLLSDLSTLGSAPLPPYIRRPGGVADERDRSDYQTVFAREPGAIAAPTAGLHLTPELLAGIDERGVVRVAVTLHVGLGTFKPVRVARVEEHRMESERGEIPEEAAEAVNCARAEGRRVVAVGTTTVRTLEASALAHGGRVGAGQFRTDLYLTPGATFRVVDALLTNFHLPRSTLLMLVCAFAGRENVLQAYRAAVREGYRFFSYGDAMWIA